MLVSVYINLLECIMAIKVKIRELAEKQGIKTAYQLKIQANLAPSTASRCFNNKLTLITFETLDKLCAALNCEPNDLLVLQKS